MLPEGSRPPEENLPPGWRLRRSLIYCAGAVSFVSALFGLPGLVVDGLWWDGGRRGECWAVARHNGVNGGADLFGDSFGRPWRDRGRRLVERCEGTFGWRVFHGCNIGALHEAAQRTKMSRFPNALARA
jgi:hypothetical protein